MRVTVLGGGSTHARFISDLGRISGSDVELSTVVTTTNDLYAFGLKISPDLDAVLAACSPKIGPSDAQIRQVLSALGAQPDWLAIDDATLGLDIVRNEMMLAGFSLTEVTQAMASRLGIEVAILPMSNDRIEHHIVIQDEAGQRAVHVLEYLARYTDVDPLDQVFIGIESAVGSSEAIHAITDADVIIIGPASPALHLDPMLRLPSLYKAIQDSSAPILGVSFRESDHEQLRSITGASENSREHFSGLVSTWASGTAAEVLAAARELLKS